jgi:hypothetical protein
MKYRAASLTRSVDDASSRSASSDASVTTDVRTEYDSLGAVEVPADGYGALEVEKVLHSGRFQLTDVATADSGARNQGADVMLAKIGNAFNAEPPVEQYRRRPGQEKQGISNEIY